MKLNNHSPQITVTEQSLLRRVEIFLEDGDFDRADEYCERVLDMNVENGEAYLYKLLARLGFAKKQQLYDLDEPFNNDPLYLKIMRFGSDGLKKEVEGINNSITEKIEESKKRKAYEKGLSLYESNAIPCLKEAYLLFSSLVDYENSKELAVLCKEKCESIYDNLYNSFFSEIKADEQAIKDIKYRTGADAKERDDYGLYIEESKTKRIFDYSFLSSGVCILICGLIIFLVCQNYFDLAGVSGNTVFRCIFTTILPGVLISALLTYLSFIISKRLVKKQRKDLLEDMNTAVERAREINDKLSESEQEIQELTQRLNEGLEKLRKLNEDYDNFCEAAAVK